MAEKFDVGKVDQAITPLTELDDIPLVDGAKENPFFVKRMDILTEAWDVH